MLQEGKEEVLLLEDPQKGGMSSSWIQGTSKSLQELICWLVLTSVMILLNLKDSLGLLDAPQEGLGDALI